MQTAVEKTGSGCRPKCEMRREARLTSREDYRSVYKRGKSVANKELVLYFLKKENNGKRFGISVSKKIGSAVVRNRVKRLIKETIRRNQESIKNGYDLILIARQPAREKSFHEVEKAFIDALKKAGLYKGRDEESNNSVN